MPQNKNLMDSPEAAKLLQNKAALNTLLNAPETKQLMSALTKSHGGKLTSAAKAAKAGNPAALAAMVNDFAASQEGAALIQRLQSNLPKS